MSSNPSTIVDGFEAQEIGNRLPRIIEIILKIKNELKIDAFIDLVTHVENLYSQIITHKDVSLKTLTFMDGMSIFCKAVNCKKSDP